MTPNTIPSITAERLQELYDQKEEAHYYEMVAINRRMMELRIALRRIGNGEPIDPRKIAREALEADERAEVQP